MVSRRGRYGIAQRHTSQTIELVETTMPDLSKLPVSGRKLLSALKTGTVLAAIAAATVTFDSSAMAGPQYVDESGYAASGYDVVAYFDLEQAPIGHKQPAAVPGKSWITAEYNGATFAFSSEANRDKFVADPARYAPQYDGFCAYGVTHGGKAPGNPHLWRIVDGKLYLNLQPSIVELWEEDIEGLIKDAEQKWTAIAEAPPKSDRPVPELDISLAPLKSRD